jgi:hypothetical protein
MASAQIGRGLDQLQSLKTHVAVLADDDVIVHRNAERVGQQIVSNSADTDQNITRN